MFQGEYKRLLDQLSTHDALVESPPSQLMLEDGSFIRGTPLPNEVTTLMTSRLIELGCVQNISLTNKPLLPIRGKISTRGGHALKRSDVPRVIDDFVLNCHTQTVFVVQGGNRYITNYIANHHQVRTYDMKLVCASKASLATILLTILCTKDLATKLSAHQVDTIFELLASTDGLALMLQSNSLIKCEIDRDFLASKDLCFLIEFFCNITIKTPFAYPTDDSKLRQEFEEMHDALSTDAITIPNIEIVRVLLKSTTLRQRLDENQRIVFIDDLFYRGRTLFTIFCILEAFGLDAQRAHLYTMCADRVSYGLKSSHITVLNTGALYPFENSMRTERGYWQRAHGRFIFTDLEVYWQYLAHVVNASETMNIYENWQELLEVLWLQLPSNKLTKKMAYALIWYLVFHKAHEIPVDLASLIDQRGEGIGYCVPYARIVDNFISQEEPVEKRTAFKQCVSEVVTDIWNIDQKDGEVVDKLVQYYRKNANAIDYEGLGFMFDIYDYGI